MTSLIPKTLHFLAELELGENKRGQQNKDCLPGRDTPHGREVMVGDDDTAAVCATCPHPAQKAGFLDRRFRC